MKKIRESKNKRLRVVLLLSTLGLLALILRLAYWQLIQGKELSRQALTQWTKAESIKPQRGLIYDSKGRKLAINTSSFTILAQKDLIEDKEALAEDLSELINMDKNDIVDKLNGDREEVKLKEDASVEEVVAIRALSNRALKIEEEDSRHYPNKNFASYVLGFTDKDNRGLDGVEYTYNEYLTGHSGKWLKLTDAGNRPLPYDGDKVYDPEDGHSLVLTIDENIQGFAEKAAEEAMEEHGAKTVSVIVMDPKNADILALVNKPDYDPNQPRVALDDEVRKEWADLEEEELLNKWYEMWRNYSISDVYEPGSTFKLITTAAALEEATTSLDSHYYCNGFVRDIKGARPIRCVRWYDPHGNMNLSQSLNVSCNVAFVNLARELGKENLLKYIKAFGFGEKTGIDLLGEQVGIIPSSAENIREINLATMSYGHGISMTPMQLANSVAAISNGGYLMRPRLAKGLVDKDGKLVRTFEPYVIRRVISKDTSDTMLSLMEGVVRDGSGSRAGVAGYRIGGKTGTAQKIIDGMYAKDKYIGSFVGVAPIDDPQYLISVLVDEPEDSNYGGLVAAPVASKIFKRIFDYQRIEAQLDEAAGERLIEVPDLKGLTLVEAGQTLYDLGLRYTTEYGEISEDSVIFDHYPAEEMRVKRDTVIDLYVNSKASDKTIMPYLIKRTEEEVLDIMNKMKLKYKFQGEGRAVKQMPGPGEEIDDNIEILVEFE